MTAAEINVMISFGLLVATIIIGILTIVVMILSKKEK